MLGLMDDSIAARLGFLHPGRRYYPGYFMNPPFRNHDGRDEGRETSSSVDETLRVLKHPVRRDLIECCSTADEQIFDIRAIADDVASAREAVGDSVDTAELQAQLHHQHLPLLANIGVIEYDPRGGQFRYEQDELLEQWLRRIRAEETK